MRISDWSSDVGSSDVYAQGGVEDERRQTDGLIVGVENVVEPRHRPVEIPEEAHARPLPRHARLVPVGLIGRYAEEGAVRVVEGAVRGGQKPDRIAGLTRRRSEEHTYELPSLMRISYAVFRLKKNTHHHSTLL